MNDLDRLKIERECERLVMRAAGNAVLSFCRPSSGGARC